MAPGDTRTSRQPSTRIRRVAPSDQGLIRVEMARAAPNGAGRPSGDRSASAPTESDRTKVLLRGGEATLPIRYGDGLAERAAEQREVGKARNGSGQLTERHG